MSNEATIGACIGLLIAVIIVFIHGRVEGSKSGGYPCREAGINNLKNIQISPTTHEVYVCGTYERTAMPPTFRCYEMRVGCSD